MVEEFRTVEGFEGYYEVSNLGNVKSLVRPFIRANGYTSRKREKFLIHSMGGGYKHVTLCKDGKVKRLRVHRLIAIMFIPNPENKPTVNHIDGNKLNNDISNLEWATHKENHKHAWDTGLITEMKIEPAGKGEKHFLSKLTEDDVRFIRKNAKRNGGNFNNVEFAKIFGVNKDTIRSVIIFKNWKHVI